MNERVRVAGVGYSTVTTGDALSSVTAEMFIRVDMLRRDAKGSHCMGRDEEFNLIFPLTPVFYRVHNIYFFNFKPERPRFFI